MQLVAWDLKTVWVAATIAISAVMNGESHKADDDREASKPYDIDVTCPSCHSFDCVRAGRQGINDFIRVLVGRFPWKCRRCLHRFYLRRRTIG